MIFYTQWFREVKLNYAIIKLLSTAFEKLMHLFKRPALNDRKYTN